MNRSSFPASVLSAALFLTLAGCGGGNSNNNLVGGTMTGLPANTTAVLENNLKNDLTVSTNTTFTFTTGLAESAAYSVTVLTQPLGATCAVTNGSGTISSNGGSISNVAVACTVTATIAGTVAGLVSGTSVTLTNGALSLALSANGAFVIPGLLVAGTTYDVVVSAQSVGHSCTVANNTGTVVANTQTAVVVTCI